MKTLDRSRLPLLLAGCAEALYPPRPPAIPGPPVADPAPSRVVVHATWASPSLKHAIDEWLPPSGEGTFQVMGSPKTYKWRRSPSELSFDRGRLVAKAHVMGTVAIFGSNIDFPIDLTVRTEPVVTADYKARLQSVDVEVTSNDPRLKMAQGVAGALDLLRDQIANRIKDFSYDLRPLVAEALRPHRRARSICRSATRTAAPSCACLGVEAGPTVLADGVEKDLAVVVAPSVTLPCAAPAARRRALPPLANVAVAAARALHRDRADRRPLRGAAARDGARLHRREAVLLQGVPRALHGEARRSTRRADQLVLKLHMHGPDHKLGIDTTLDGDLYMRGHPAVVDNELRVPDLSRPSRPRASSSSSRRRSTATTSATRRAPRCASTSAIASRRCAASSPRSRLLAGERPGSGCLRADVSKIEVTGVHAHGNYLRLYVPRRRRPASTCPAPRHRQSPHRSPVSAPETLQPKNGYLQLVGGANVSLIVRGETQRMQVQHRCPPCRWCPRRARRRRAAGRPPRRSACR